MIKIEMPARKMTSFCNIVTGQMFLKADKLYIKIPIVRHAGDADAANAYCIGDTHFEHFLDTDEVVSVNSNIELYFG